MPRKCYHFVEFLGRNCLELLILGSYFSLEFFQYRSKKSLDIRVVGNYTNWEVAKKYTHPNARIFRETKSRDRKFTDRTFQDRKILGPESSRNSIFSRNSRNIFLRKFQDFFLLEQKIPGLLTLLNSWTTNSVTEFSRTFFTFLSL